RKYLSQFGLVEELAFIHALAHGIMYTRSCKVKMASVDSVAANLEKPRHFIEKRLVTIEPYQGEAEHQWLYVRGKFKVKLKGLEVNLNECELYEILEKTFAGCGRYSEIHLMKNRRSLTGVAVIDFIKKGDIRQALKIAREELKCEAFRIRSRTRPGC
nr:hypothetical protein [Tanacetum cinerariifolium]